MLQVLYGDKDAIRLAFLMSGVDLGLVADPPGQVLQRNGGQFTRLYVQAMYKGQPLTIDQATLTIARATHPTAAAAADVACLRLCLCRVSVFTGELCAQHVSA